MLNRIGHRMLLVKDDDEAMDEDKGTGYDRAGDDDDDAGVGADPRTRCVTFCRALDRMSPSKNLHPRTWVLCACWWRPFVSTDGRD